MTMIPISERVQAADRGRWSVNQVVTPSTPPKKRWIIGSCKSGDNIAGLSFCRYKLHTIGSSKLGTWGLQDHVDFCLVVMFACHHVDSYLWARALNDRSFNQVNPDPPPFFYKQKTKGSWDGWCCWGGEILPLEAAQYGLLRAGYVRATKFCRLLSVLAAHHGDFLSLCASK